MMQPLGFEQSASSRSSNLVCRLHKALYGLKQAPRAWFNKLNSVLHQLHFQSSKSDSSLFFQHTKEGSVYLLVYVDDLVITGPNPLLVNKVVTELNSFFTLKDLGELNYFLGIAIKRESGVITLSQENYIRELLEKAGMVNAKPLPTPMASNTVSSANDGSSFEDILRAQFCQIS